MERYNLFRARPIKTIRVGSRCGLRQISSDAGSSNAVLATVDKSTTTPPLTIQLPQIALRKIRHIHAPNKHPRPAIHNINIASRLGVRLAQKAIGGQEWQTSTYHYNKALGKNYPVATQITDKLLESYVALKPRRLDASGGSKPESKAEVNARRKSLSRTYVSESRVKDFGNRVVIEAFVYKEEPKERGPRRGGKRR